MVATLQVTDTAAVITLTETLGVATDAAFREIVQQAFGEGRRELVVDLRQVSHIDSTGLAALIAVREKANAQGVRLILAGPSPRVRRVLDVTHLAGVFEVTDDVPDRGGVHAS